MRVGSVISPETARLCLELLAQVPLSVTDPEFEAKSERLVAARDELAAVLADETHKNP